MRGSSRQNRNAPDRRRLLVPLGLMAAIFFSSHRPSPVPLPSGSDKLAHAAVYAALAASWVYALRPPAARPAPGCLLAGALSAGWGGLDEVHQGFVPGRNASLGDLAADAAGAAAAAGAAWSRRRRGCG
ncbi:MAG: hypothetical protein D6718_03340 [Acidobacteria bacterium]|nr:MAG: hypothetical protein D6718_03340 [Acidobacteriota bacterium]